MLMMMMMMMMIIIIIIIPKIHFIHLGIKEVYYCSFTAFYIICALFSTKCHLFQKCIFFVRLILTVSKIPTLSFKVSTLLCLFYPSFTHCLMRSLSLSLSLSHTHTHCTCYSSYLILLHLITLIFDNEYKLQNSLLQNLDQPHATFYYGQYSPLQYLIPTYPPSMLFPYCERSSITVTSNM
jgi:hypothetical protein